MKKAKGLAIKLSEMETFRHLFFSGERSNRESADRGEEETLHGHRRSLPSVDRHAGFVHRRARRHGLLSKETSRRTGNACEFSAGKLQEAVLPIGLNVSLALESNK